MYLILAAIIVIFVVLHLAGLASAGNVGRLVTIVSPVRGAFRDSVRISGTVSGEETRVIYAPVGGLLAEVHVAAGDAVKAGELLACYDMQKMEKTLRQSGLRLKRSAAGYNSVPAVNGDNNVNLNEAGADPDIPESLKRSSGNAVDTYDRNWYDADKELADMAYAEAEAEYHAAEQGIVAGFDGIVTECMVHSGAAVTEGMQLLTLESSRDLNVSIKASQNDVLKLELGQRADVEIAGKIYPGEVSRINRMAERSESGSPLIGAKIHLLETDDTIILGLDAKLTIYTNQVKNALLVPLETVNADRNGNFLYVVQEGIIVRKSIVCGNSSEACMEVLDGISQEDQIIIGSDSELSEGMQVTAVSAL